MKKEFKGENVTITVDYDKCTGSGECISACPVDMYELRDGKAFVKNIDQCIECCLCVNACPNGAIEHSSC